MRVCWLAYARARGRARALSDERPSALALGVRSFLAPAEAACAAAAVEAAQAEWTSDFGGEQYCLGRAFYTHFETDRSRLYFADARASDARVEARLPGMQARMRALVSALVGADTVARRGWCGAGAHVFPPGEAVARRGGVVHADTEGLTLHHSARGLPALTAVVMLQPPERGGGLRLWDERRSERDELAPDEVDAPSRLVRLRAGDALVFDSYRLHQIQRFGGTRARISLTLHAAAIARDRWESWF